MNSKKKDQDSSLRCDLDDERLFRFTFHDEL